MLALIRYTIFRQVLLRRASIPFIHSCLVGLSPRAGSHLSRLHPSCMREGALLIILV